MSKQKKVHPEIKSGLHPRNKHRERYDFEQLIDTSPELSAFTFENEYGDTTIDFFNPKAVKALNKALLLHYYGIIHWDIPENYLCPPVPGRADYIHYAAELLAALNNGNIPVGKNVHCLDIGTGANLIYPIIGNKEYGWSFTGSEIDEPAIENANRILDSNPSLKENVDIRKQNNKDDFFEGVIRPGERFELTVCNPPFHASAQDAQEATQRKLSHLKGKNGNETVLNFGGASHELWCEGGEELFVRKMIFDSKEFSKNCLWFTVLVSKSSSLETIYDALSKKKATEVKTIPMGQGNKISRVVAWTFLSAEEQRAWFASRTH